MSDRLVNVTSPGQLVGRAHSVDWNGERTVLRRLGLPGTGLVVPPHTFGWARSGGGRKYHVAMARAGQAAWEENAGLTLCGKPVTATVREPAPDSLGDVCTHCVRVRTRYYGRPL
jgi:hypothetical protein